VLRYDHRALRSLLPERQHLAVVMLLLLLLAALGAALGAGGPGAPVGRGSLLLDLF